MIEQQPIEAQQSQEPSRLRKFGRGFMGSLAIAAVAGGVWVGAPKAMEAFKYDESAIKAGVTGQVERHDHRDIPLLGGTRTEYSLEIEQCPQDVVAAQNGQETKSFHPDWNKVNAACVVDWVSVSRSTYQKYADGDEITLNGNLGEPLHKLDD